MVTAQQPEGLLEMVPGAGTRAPMVVGKTNKHGLDHMSIGPNLHAE